MSDRELLELAAKAAGYEVLRHPNNKISRDLIFIHKRRNWNPLTDDGDAFRLAVQLRLQVSTPHKDYRAFVQSQDLKRGVSANDGDDDLNDTNPCAATRRAIVRCAAEIGKAMP